MMRTGITITLATDVPPGGNVDAVETALLASLNATVADYVDAAPTLHVAEEPAPYKTGENGGYRLMRDEEGAPQYTEVRARAYLVELPTT